MTSSLVDRLRIRISRLMHPAAERRVRHARINGYELLVLASEDVGRSITVNGRYEERDSAFLASRIRPADVCLDVGANVGYYTLLMARCASEGQVLAFEPVLLNFHLLSASIELNKVGNVTLNMCAVGAKDGTSEFSEAADTAYSSLVNVRRKPEARRISTAVVSIDAYMKRAGIARVDVLKIDVEGAEALVIAGARATFSQPSSRPRLVLMELFDQNLAAYETTVNQVIDDMRAFGYLSYCIGRNQQPRRLQVRDYNRIYNVFFAPEGDIEAFG